MVVYGIHFILFCNKWTPENRHLTTKADHELPTWDHPAIFISVVFSILMIIWGSFLRSLPSGFLWMEWSLDPIVIGVVATFRLLLLALLFVAFNQRKELDR